MTISIPTADHGLFIHHYSPLQSFCTHPAASEHTASSVSFLSSRAQFGIWTFRISVWYFGSGHMTPGRSSREEHGHLVLSSSSSVRYSICSSLGWRGVIHTGGGENDYCLPPPRGSCPALLPSLLLQTGPFNVSPTNYTNCECLFHHTPGSITALDPIGYPPAPSSFYLVQIEALWIPHTRIGA